MRLAQWTSWNSTHTVSGMSLSSAPLIPADTGRRRKLPLNSKEVLEQKRGCVFRGRPKKRDQIVQE